MIKKCLTIVMCSLLIASAVMPQSTGAKTKSRTVTAYRGSCLVWSKDLVSFSYDGKKVKKSAGDQLSGGALIIDVSCLGIKKRSIYSNSSAHVWRGKKKFRAGVTLFGQTLGYSTTVVDDITVKKNGTYSVKWDAD